MAGDGPSAGATTRTRRVGASRVVPALDGLRALAVIAVMLYHFGVGGARGGFLGVDVFFVLSGYLITGQLMTRWVATGPDGIRLRSFWAARARRLLPGLGALLLGTTFVMLLVDRVQLSEFRGDLIAALGYVSNWWYVFHHTSYFVASGRPPVLQHLWSLAVEEQFYLVWPLVVAGLVLACRDYPSRRRAVLAVAIGGAVASTLVMLVGSLRSGAPLTADPSRWYFGSDSHVMGLCTGAALAAWRHGDGLGSARRVDRASAGLPATMAGVGALALVLVCCARADEFAPWLYRGGFFVVGLLTAVVIAVAGQRGLLARLLSIPLLRDIGRRSYALYLWHWPVACFTRPGVDLPIGQHGALLLRLGLTGLLAEISYQWVERPVRVHGWQAYWAWMRSLRLGRVTVPTALAATVGAMSIGLVLPASAAPTEATYRGGGTVYVAGPHGHGVVAEHPGSTGGSGAHLTAPSGGVKTPTEPTGTAPAGPTKGGAQTGDGRGSSRTPPIPHTVADLKRDDLVVYGDSVPLGAIGDLVQRFRSVSNHAVEGVQSWTLLPELEQAGRAGLLNGDIVVLHTGDNGIVSRSQLDDTLAALSKAMRVIVAIPYVPRPWQADNAATIQSVAGHYPNVRLMNWSGAARAQPDYLWSDGVHLTPTGESAYTALVTATAIEH